jgi:hypothetical protein
MFLSIQQTRLLLVAIGLVAALIVAFDLARVAGNSQSAPRTAVYVGTPHNTPGSTAHLRQAYRISLGRSQAGAS